MALICRQYRMPAEDRERHWAEGAARLALVAAVTVILIGLVYWLFVHWSLGNSRYPGLIFAEDEGRGWMKAAGRLTLSSLATVGALGAEALLFRWYFRW